MNLNNIVDTIERLKIFPRISIFGFQGYSVFYIQWTTQKYFELNAPNWGETSFCAVVIIAMLTFLLGISKAFLELTYRDK